MKTFEMSVEALEMIANRFRLLSEPTRLNILHVLGHDEMSVTAIVEATGLGQANVSRHLGVLLSSGMVARRREGVTANYRVCDPTVFDICDLVCSNLRQQLVARQSALAPSTS